MRSTQEMVSGATHAGKRSKHGISDRLRSQPALLATKMCASGAMPTFVVNAPAGTTSMLPSAYGMADPQIEQNDLVCLVAGNVYLVSVSSPESQLRRADVENRLAA